VSDINKDNGTPKKNSFMKGLVEQVELVVIVFVIIVLLFSFAARICQVSGDSMRDTLYNGENVVVSDVFYTPQRGDIIVFHQTGESANDYNEPIVKRVIGVAGDTVKVEHLRNGMRVTVTDSDGNSTVLDEDYIRYEYPTYSDSITYVEEGTVFVMGDNRSDSSDSRSMRIGLVDTRRILGKVVVRVTPFSRFGKVN
jgi:signal peptidase I